MLCSNGFLEVSYNNGLYKRLLLGFLGFAHKVNGFRPFCGDFVAQFWCSSVLSIFVKTQVGQYVGYNE